MSNLENQINILVTGAGGQLGQEIKRISENNPNYHFIFATRDELDIASASTINTFIKKNNIHYCINAAAYTQVDKAETERQLCMDINATAVGHLAKALHDADATLIHISSDYVYHNDLRRPLLESDPTHPQGQYAQSKLAGEMLVAENNPKSIIIRASWLFSSHGNNFVKTMIRLLNDRDEISVVNDQIGCPTYAYDLASAISQIIDQLNQAELVDPIIYRTYNFCNQGTCSWFDFAVAINTYTGLNKKILSIPSSDYPTLAPRPLYSVMDTSLLQDTFDLEIKEWEEGLRDCLEEMK